jgi:hypothetical protein
MRPVPLGMGRVRIGDRRGRVEFPCLGARHRGRKAQNAQSGDQAFHRGLLDRIDLATLTAIDRIQCDVDHMCSEPVGCHALGCAAAAIE